MWGMCNAHANSHIRCAICTLLCNEIRAFGREAAHLTRLTVQGLIVHARKIYLAQRTINAIFALALLFAAVSLPAGAGIIEFTTLRSNWQYDPNAAVAATFDSVLPGLTTVELLNNGTVRYFGPGSDSVLGQVTVHTNHNTPDGLILFAGSTQYVSGTGFYAGVSGFSAFAGFLDPIARRQTVSDFGFMLVPNLGVIDLGFFQELGTPAGDPTPGPQSRRDVPLTSGAVAGTFPFTGNAPFQLDTVTVDPIGGYQLTGPRSNIALGTYDTRFSVTAGPISNIFSGSTQIIGGGGDGWTVTGGAGVFAGRNANLGFATLQSADDYGFISAQRVPEPNSLPLLAIAAASLFVARMKAEFRAIRSTKRIPAFTRHSIPIQPNQGEPTV